MLTGEALLYEIHYILTEWFILMEAGVTVSHILWAAGRRLIS